MNKKNFSEIDVTNRAQVEEAASAIIAQMKAENKTFHEVLGLSEAFLERLYAIAYTYYNQGKTREALHYFRLLTSMNAKCSKYHFGLGASFHQVNEFEAAASAFVIALSLDPTHPLPAYYAADSYLKINQLEPAKECLEIALEIAGDEEEHKHLKERCLLIKKTIKKA